MIRGRWPTSLADDVMQLQPRAGMEITLTKPRFRQFAWFTGAALALLSLTALSTSNTAVEDIETLRPEERHERIGNMVTEFIQRSHYMHINVDDELSSRVLDLFIESLDRNRIYLLESDIAYFEQFRYKLDDMVKSEPLDPVYDMFEIFQTRARDRKSVV